MIEEFFFSGVEIFILKKIAKNLRKYYCIFTEFISFNRTELIHLLLVLAEISFDFFTKTPDDFQTKFSISIKGKGHTYVFDGHLVGNFGKAEYLNLYGEITLEKVLIRIVQFI